MFRAFSLGFYRLLLSGRFFRDADRWWKLLTLARCFIFCWLSFSNVQKSNMRCGYDPYYVLYWFFYGGLVFSYYASGVWCTDSGVCLGFTHPSQFNCSCAIMVLISAKQWGLYDELMLEALFSVSIVYSGYLMFFMYVSFHPRSFEHYTSILSFIQHCEFFCTRFNKDWLRSVKDLIY